MDLIAPILSNLALMAIIMLTAWVVQRGTRNGGWVDVFWTFGTGAVCVVAAFWPGAVANAGRQLLVAALAAIWALRLGGYIFHRVASDAHEDRRYAGLRTEWGGAFQRNMVALCLVQAPAAALLSVSILVASHGGGSEMGVRDLIGALVLVVGIAGEGLADEQMRRFRKTAAKGAVMDRGLWAWSRHPNYFFEWVVWLAYPVIAFDPAVPLSWASLVAPLMMFFVLRYGTGVPALEKAMLASRGDAFRNYQKRVSPFFPLPPKRSST